MINVNEIKKVLVERKRIFDETQDNWDDGIQMCWDKLIAILTKNINESIRFLEHECSPDDIYWVSEVFDDIARKTQSKDFIAVIHRIYDKMPEDVKETMEVDIRSAEQAID